MNDKLTLTDGIEAVFDDIIRAYTATVQYHGYELEVTLSEYEENPDTVEALKFAFEKIYKDMEKWDAAGMDALCDKVVPMLNNYPEEENVTAEDIRRDYVLKSVAILDDDRVGVIMPEDVRVELTYMGKDDDPDDYDSMDLSAAGTLEEGFSDVYLNGTLITNRPFLEDRTLCNGDPITYSALSEVYSGEVEILDDYVECYFELDEDRLGVDKAVELFEKVYKKSDLFDKMARKFIFSEIEPYMKEIRDALDDPSLEIDEIMEDMFPDSIVFENNGGLELSYRFFGIVQDLKLTVAGFYNMGFTRMMVEYMDDEEDY